VWVSLNAHVGSGFDCGVGCRVFNNISEVWILGKEVSSLFGRIPCPNIGLYLKMVVEPDRDNKSKDFGCHDK